MKLLLVLCIFVVVGVCMADYPRGCIWINGHCQRECEEGTHGYSTGCGFLTPEPTCDEPNPKEDTKGRICDFTACYCDPPTVRDRVTKKCVLVENCSKGGKIPEEDKSDRV